MSNDSGNFEKMAGKHIRSLKVLSADEIAEEREKAEELNKKLDIESELAKYKKQVKEQLKAENAAEIARKNNLIKSLENELIGLRAERGSLPDNDFGRNMFNNSKFKKELDSKIEKLETELKNLNEDFDKQRKLVGELIEAHNAAIDECNKTKKNAEDALFKRESDFKVKLEECDNTKKNAEDTLAKRESNFNKQLEECNKKKSGYSKTSLVAGTGLGLLAGVGAGYALTRGTRHRSKNVNKARSITKNFGRVASRKSRKSRAAKKSARKSKKSRKSRATRKSRARARRRLVHV